jgi:hypothetical protein
VTRFRLFTVVLFEGKPLSYLTVSAGDLLFREFNQVVTPYTRRDAPWLPVLFKTLSAGGEGSGGPANDTLGTGASKREDGVLAASFVIKELLPAELAAMPDMPAAHMRSVTTP